MAGPLQLLVLVIYNATCFQPFVVFFLKNITTNYYTSCLWVDLMMPHFYANLPPFLPYSHQGVPFIGIFFLILLLFCQKIGPWLLLCCLFYLLNLSFYFNRYPLIFLKLPVLLDYCLYPLTIILFIGSLTYSYISTIIIFVYSKLNCIVI